MRKDFLPILAARAAFRHLIRDLQKQELESLPGTATRTRIQQQLATAQRELQQLN